MQPQWINKFLEAYQAGIAHGFIFHFNIGDHVAPDSLVTPATYLAKMMVGTGREIVAVYSRDRGITFPVESMKQRALEVLGIEQQDNSGNAALAALQSLGMAGDNSDSELPRTPGDALPILDQLIRYTNDEGKGSALIIENAELIIPDGPLASMSEADRNALAILSRWGKDSELVNLGNPVMLLTGNITNLHSNLREASNRYESIEIGLPGLETRLEFVQSSLTRQPVKLADNLTAEQIANATAGLSLLHIEDILLRAQSTGTLTRRLIQDRKEDIIKSEFGDVLEVIEPRFGFDDIGDLSNVKAFFKNSIIRPIREGRKSRVPMGVLMTGPAGTGKSIMAEAVAKEAGVNAVNLRIGGQIASKWQGEGERNLAKALRAVQSLSPCIVFIDEIDQSVQRGTGQGGSQQDQRIFQRLLEFMSDTAHRGEIVFLAATNRPDLMDAALRRPGRFDKKIPFFVPELEGRLSIFQVMGRRYLGVNDLEINPETLKATEGWTGAEIEAAAVKAAELVEDYELTPAEAISRAVIRLRPSTADIELMTWLAVQEANDLDLLPEKYQKMLDKPEEVEARIKTAKEAQSRGRREL